jgi:hypothetical protein
MLDSIEDNPITPDRFASVDFTLNEWRAAEKLRDRSGKVKGGRAQA